jgi:peptide/nickel transport system substrate-binding protein
MDRESERRLDALRARRSEVENHAIDELLAGNVSRRDFLRWGTVLGMSLPTLAAILEACASGSQGGTTGPPVKGGTLNVATSGNPKSLDAHVYQLRVTNVVTSQIYDTLTYLDESTMSLQPRLATEWKYENDTTFAITLRSGVKFHNGQPFSASDVQYSINRIQAPATGSYLAGFMAPVSSVEVVDPTHLRLRLSKITPGLPEIFSRVPIMSPSAKDTVETKPVGTGPFRFVEWLPNESLKIERNPNHWEKDYPYLDAVVYKIIPDADARLASLQSRAVDIDLDVASKDYARLKTSQTLVGGVPAFGDTMEFCYLNNRASSPMSNKLVRQAVAYAFDSKRWLELAFPGTSVYNRSIFAPGHWAHDSKIAAAYSLDPKKAADLLAQAGYPGGKGLKLKINPIQGFPEWQLGSEMMQASLSNLGVSVEVQVQDVPTWVDALVTTHKYDISWDNPNYSASEPTLFFGIPWSHTTNAKNIVGLDLPAYQAKVDEAQSTLDRDKRKQAIIAASELWNEAMPGITHGNVTRPMLWRSQVHGFAVPFTDLVVFRTVWLSK